LIATVAATENLGGWGRFIPPHSAQDLLIDQMVTSITYLAISLVLGFLRRKTKPFELIAVLRALISGVSLPVTLILAAVPVFPDVISLFNT